jgi:hypothetical protein
MAAVDRQSLLEKSTSLVDVARGTPGAPEDDALVVTNGLCPSCPSVHASTVYHRAIPEIRAQAETPRMAAESLLRDLIASVDNVADGWHRNLIQNAINDIRAFVAHQP